MGDSEKKGSTIVEESKSQERVLSSNPRAFTNIFSPSERCSEPEFILESAPYYYNSEEDWFRPVRCFVECCHPNAFDLELCEKLCRIGFPIWVAKPNIEASFLRGFQCFKTLPPRFKNDRAIFESVAKNDCEILQDAIPEFRKDIPLVTAIFEHNPGVLHFCDPSIFDSEAGAPSR